MHAHIRRDIRVMTFKRFASACLFLLEYVCMQLS